MTNTATAIRHEVAEIPGGALLRTLDAATGALLSIKTVEPNGTVTTIVEFDADGFRIGALDADGHTIDPYAGEGY
jgi:hypothetical protein